MLFKAAFLAPALALSPVGVSDIATPVHALDASAAATEAPLDTRRPVTPGWSLFEAWRAEMEARQVRIRQEIMIRVSPRRESSREMIADWRQAIPRSYEQRDIGKCVAARKLVAVQTVSSRDLVLYLSDNRMIRAQLRKSCNARDFYLGFYMETNKDGELCAGRDTLRARNGATCKIGAIRQLVPAE